MATRDRIRHVIVLMMENRSYDQILGGFGPAWRGVDPDRLVTLDGISQGPGTPSTIVDPDPGHDYADFLAQYAGGSMDGFIRSYRGQQPAPADPMVAEIMRYFPRGSLSATHALAASFTTCSRWYASVPGPTWPNRFFAMTGTSRGVVSMPRGAAGDISMLLWDRDLYWDNDQTSVFDLLNAAGVSWRVYHNGMAQSLLLSRQREPSVIRRCYRDGWNAFVSDCQGSESSFPAFSWVEPHYFKDCGHPSVPASATQAPMATVYNALRANPELWNSSLLVVLTDEWGGFYDHGLPVVLTPPGEPPREACDFTISGFRVPALVVSPWVRPAYCQGVGSAPVDRLDFDHTSILRFVIERFLQRPITAADLGPRVAAQPSIEALLTDDGPNAGPQTIPADPVVLPAGPAPTVALADLTAHQRLLLLASGQMMEDLKGSGTAVPDELLAAQTPMASDAYGDLGAQRIDFIKSQA